MERRKDADQTLVMFQHQPRPALFIMIDHRRQVLILIWKLREV